MKKWIYFILLLSLLFPMSGSNAVNSPAISSPAQVLGVAHGAHIRASTDYGNEIADFNNLVGKNLATVLYTLSWNTYALTGEVLKPYYLDQIRNVLGNDAPVVLFSWAPLYGRTPGCQKNYTGVIPPADIIAGKCDKYIRDFAQALKARPERFLLRFAHEMNIRDKPWWPGHFNGDASLFVRMYRHVHDVFESQNVPNVEWVWAPNYESNPIIAWNDRNNYYPGDDYVDWIGVSGYNWWTYSNSVWRWFDQIYDSAAYRYVLDDFACNYAKPQLIDEFGSVEGSGGAYTKAAWIADAYLSMPQHPFLRGIYWYNEFAGYDANNADFRITTGYNRNGVVNPLPAGTHVWTNAYKQAIANPVYKTTLPSLEDATPITTYCGNGESVFQATPTSASVSYNVSSHHQITGMLYAQNTTFSLRVPDGTDLTGIFSPNPLLPPWGVTELTIQVGPNTPGGTYNVVVQGNGVDLLTISVKVLPSVLPNHNGRGAPGSKFTVNGINFPPNTPAVVSSNGHTLIDNALSTNGIGKVQFCLGTTQADAGYYAIIVDAIERGIGMLLIAPGEPTWQDCTADAEIPPGTAQDKLIYLPLVVR